MATRILEYGGPGDLGRAYPVIPADQFILEQTALTASSTSAQSAAVNSDTALVIVDSDEQVYVSLGASPTATANSIRIAAGGRAEFSVPMNAGWKVAVKT